MVILEMLMFGLSMFIGLSPMIVIAYICETQRSRVALARERRIMIECASRKDSRLNGEQVLQLAEASMLHEE